MPQHSNLSHYDGTAFRIGVESVAQVQERRYQAELQLEKERADREADQRRAALQLQNFAAEQAILMQNKAAQELADAKNPVKARQRVWAENLENYKANRNKFLTEADAVLKDNKYDPAYKKGLAQKVSAFQNSTIAEPDVMDQGDPAWTSQNFTKYLPSVPDLGTPVLSQEELSRQSVENESKNLDVRIKRKEAANLEAGLTKSGKDPNAKAGAGGLTDAQFRAYNKSVTNMDGLYQKWISNTPVYPGDEAVKGAMKGAGYDPAAYDLSQLSSAQGSPITNPKTVSWLTKRGVKFGGVRTDLATDASARFSTAVENGHISAMKLLPDETSRRAYEMTRAKFGGANTIDSYHEFRQFLVSHQDKSPAANTILDVLAGAGGAPVPATTPSDTEDEFQ